MASKVKPIPDEYRGATPYLCVKDGTRAIEFYKKAFGAREVMRMPAPDGKLGHAEVRIGAAPIMLADEHPEMDFRSPQSIGGTPVSLMVFVEDVDATFERAISEGATSLQPVEDKFYGDRSGQFEDPFGHRWSVATHVEDVSPEEMARRAAAMAEAGPEGG